LILLVSLYGHGLFQDEGLKMNEYETFLLHLKKMKLFDSLNVFYRELYDRGMSVSDDFEREFRNQISEMISNPIRCPGCTESNRDVSLEELALSRGVSGIHLKNDIQLYCEVYDSFALEIIELLRSELKELKINRPFAIQSV